MNKNTNDDTESKQDELEINEDLLLLDLADDGELNLFGLLDDL